MEKRLKEVCEVIDHMEPEQYMGLIHDVMGKLLSDREFAIGVIATALLGDRLDSKLHVRTDTDD